MPKPTIEQEVKKIDKKITFIKRRSPSKRIQRFQEQTMQVRQSKTNQFSMTLPLEWIQKLGIKKGDTLLLMNNGYDPSCIVVCQEKEHRENQIQISRVKAFLGQFGDVLANSELEAKLILEQKELRKKWSLLANQQKTLNAKTRRGDYIPPEYQPKKKVGNEGITKRRR